MHASFLLAASVTLLTCFSQLSLLSKVTPKIVNSVLNVKAVPRYSKLEGGGAMSFWFASNKNPYVLVSFAT